MQGLRCKAEKFLIAEASKDGGKDMFEDPSSLVGWVVLAESCKLDEFLAHAELYMIEHAANAVWQAPVSDRLSVDCSLRVMRGRMHFRLHKKRVTTDMLMEWHKESECSSVE